MSRRMFTVLDNKGETFDRYTIINRKTGDVYGASANPFHPQGFGQFNHNIADFYWDAAYGYSWRKYCDVEKCIKGSVSDYLNDCLNVGVKIKLSELPKDVITYIDNINEN
jgi:hypothetical protein